MKYQLTAAIVVCLLVIGAYSMNREVFLQQPSERDILIDLFNSTNGPNWYSKSRWLSDTTICTWYGVTCDSNGVLGLDLGHNRLTGTIPPSIGLLKNLRILSLSPNPKLSGTIPSSIGLLANLQQLLLYSGELSGTIPPSIGNLSNLQTLHLYDNQLSGTIPPSIGQLANLQQMLMYSNQLSGAIPSSFVKLRNLTYMDLKRNHLTHIDNFDQPLQLKSCDLIQNKFECPIREWTKIACFATCE